MRIIVNADDLGIGEPENYQTFKLMDEGKVTSATLLANGRALKDATTKIVHFPQCSFGVHLCLTEFNCLTDPKDLHPLVNEEGEFLGNVREVSPDEKLRNAVLEEWSAQIEMLKSQGVSISHIDSHHHVHSVPWIFPILKKVQKKFGIRKVRISKNIGSVSYPISSLLHAKKFIWNSALRYFYKTTTTQYFTSFFEFIELNERSPLRANSIELMVHPGGKDFEEETEILSSNWKDNLPSSAKLINYNEL